MTWALAFVSVILFAGLLAAGWFLLKFSKIIMVFEDDLGEAIGALNSVEGGLEQILEMKLFFDSPEVRSAIDGALGEVKLCRMVINKLIKRFTERSKEQFVLIIDEADGPPPQQQFPVLPGQPPGTPNPMRTIAQHRGGTIK